MNKYEMDAARERSTWRALTTAACGRIVFVAGTDERDASWMFKRCVAALENIGLDGAAWSARKLNGNKRIVFENGGEVRFVSFSAHRDGERAAHVSFDAPDGCEGA